MARKCGRKQVRLSAGIRSELSKLFRVALQRRIELKPVRVALRIEIRGLCRVSARDDIPDALRAITLQRDVVESMVPRGDKIQRQILER